MKKTRILASLLCLMMVVCALPLMQVSAAAGDGNAEVAAIMGANKVVNVYDKQIDASYDGADVATASTEQTYTADGIEFEAAVNASTYAVFAPTLDFYSQDYAAVFKLKVGAGNRMTIYTEGGSRTTSKPSNVARTNILLADARVYVGGKVGYVNDEIFVVGEDWFEIMVLHKPTTYEIYVKGVNTDGVWQKLTFESERQYEHGHSGSADTHRFYFGNKVVAEGAKAYVKSVSAYNVDTRMLTIEDALAERAGISDGMIATSFAWNLANSTMTTYTRGGNTAIVVPEGMEYTNEGLDLSETNGTDVWKFSPFAGWSPVANKNTYDDFRALYTKVKGNVTIGYLMGDGKAIDKIRSVPGQKLSVSNAKAMDGTTAACSTTRDGFNVDPTIDDNWVEYLVIPRNGNASYVYVKSATLTGNAWVKAIAIERYCFSSGSTDPNYDTYRRNGISFAGSGVVEQFRAIDFNTAARAWVASESATKPANADYLYFDEEFDVKPTYNNVSLGNAVTVDNGVAVAATKYENAEEGVAATSGAIYFSDLSIPVNGYMDIKMKSNGLKKFTLVDNEKKFETTLNCDYSAFPGTSAPYGGYVADSDMSWRTWRFVRTAEGYSVYSKTEGDSGWRMHTSNANGSAGTDAVKARFEFYGNADGVNDGNGMVDYIKIYGPAPVGALVLTDGYGTKIINDGETLVNTKSLRAIVNEEAGKLLVVTYKGDDMAKAQIVNVEDMANDSAIFDVRATDATKIKVFLWDNFSSFNRLAPAVTLGL